MIGRIIAAAFQFLFMALAINVIDRRDPSYLPMHSKARSRVLQVSLISANKQRTTSQHSTSIYRSLSKTK